MINSSALRLFRVIFIKQRPFLRFHCRGAANIVESKAVKNEQCEKKMKFDITYEDRISCKKKTEADEKDKEIQIMLRSAREGRLKLQEEIIIHFEKILQIQAKLRTDGERRWEMEDDMIFHFRKILQNPTVSHTIQGKRLKVHVELFHIERELQDKKGVLCKTSNEDEKRSITDQVNDLLEKQKALQEALVLYIQTEREQETALDTVENIIKEYRRKNVDLNIYQILIPCSIMVAVLVLMLWI